MQTVSSAKETDLTTNNYDGATTLEEVKAVFNKWLYLEDKNIVDVVLATIVSNRMPTENVWLLITAASGSAKTEILRALESDEIYQISTLTGQTLVSGYRKHKKDPSLLPHLNNKTLVIKDFTSVLSLNGDDRAKVFADLRDSYDGSFAKGFGNEAEVARYNVKFGILGGVTPEIDKFHSLTNVLGERFIKYRPILTKEGRRGAIEKARQNRGQEKEMRSEIKEACSKFLKSIDATKTIETSLEAQIKIESFAEWVALLRTEVSRDGYTKEINYLPEVEVGTRLVKQLTTIGMGLALIRGKSEITGEELTVLSKIARDTLSSKRLLLFETLFKENNYLSTQDYSDLTNLPTITCERLLEDFRLLGIVDRQGSQKFNWKIQEKAHELYLKVTT